MKGRNEKWDCKGRLGQPLMGPGQQLKGLYLILGPLGSFCFHLTVLNHFNHFEAYKSAALSALTILCHHQHYLRLFLELCHHPKQKNAVPIKPWGVVQRASS